MELTRELRTKAKERGKGRGGTAPVDNNNNKWINKLFLVLRVARSVFKFTFPAAPRWGTGRANASQDLVTRIVAGDGKSVFPALGVSLVEW